MSALSLLPALVVTALTAQNAEKPRWWQELPREVLAELRCQQFDELDLPTEWRTTGGRLRVVEDRWGAGGKIPTAPGDPGETPRRPARVALEATAPSGLSAGKGDWRHYVATAEVMPAGGPQPLIFCVAAGDAADRTAGYRLEIKADRGNQFRILASARDGTEDLLVRTVKDKKVKDWMPILARPVLSALAHSENPEVRDTALRKLSAEFVGAVGWAERWLRLRIELGPHYVRFWVDGLLVANVDRPKRAQGGVSLALGAGDRVRMLRVEQLPETSAEFLPLDLTARANADGLKSEDLGDGYALDPQCLPAAGQWISVDGVPLYWTCAPGGPNHLDLGKVAYRGRDAYVRCEAASKDPKRVMLRVPRRQYRELVLVAAADTRDQATNILNTRMVKPWRGMVLDRCCPVPRWNETRSTGEPAAVPLGVMLRSRKSKAEAGRLWLVRVPLDPGAFQDFLGSPQEPALELDLTAPPAREGYPEIVRTPSAVHVFAATLVESPVEILVNSDEVGHIFVQPKRPSLRFHLRNTTPREQSGRIEIRITDFYGNARVHSLSYSVARHEATDRTWDVPVEVLGLHDVDVRLLDSGDRLLVRRQTTLAVLPPDTRQADRDSPFGIWVFMDGHFGAGAEAAGSLISKIGARWSHVSKDLWDEGFSRRYRVYPAYSSLLRSVREPADALKHVEENPQHAYWTVFAETALGPRHYGYFPPELLEQPSPARLSPEDEKRFRDLWDVATGASAAVRKKHPQLKLIFGNGYPQFIATFLARKYPKELMDGLGLDFLGDQMYMFSYLKMVARHYGYGDLPFHITEGFYVGSGCGYYPDRQREKTQSDVYIRGFLRGMAMGVERFGAACEIWDPGSDYYYTGYGSVGLCHKAPELNPKPGYCAFATMTRLLDRAKFHSLVPTGSVNVYVLRFDGPRGPVYALWTTQGRRSVSLRVAAGARPRVTDSQGNSRAPTVQGGQAELQIDATPVWLEEAGAVAEVRVGAAVYPTAPGGAAKPLASGSDIADWRLDTSACKELEDFNHETPVKPGGLTLGVAEGRAPGAKSLAITLQKDPAVSPHRLRYAVLRPKGDGPLIPAGTEQLGIWLHGNGVAWIDLELTDAQGERWTTIRRPRSYCYGIAYGGPQSFDGWRYVPWPLPGTASSSDSSAPWASWRSEKGNRVLDFPVRLTGVVLEQYGSVVYINELSPPVSPTWRIGEMVIE